MTAHNDKVEAVARAIAEADGQMWEGLSLQYAYMTQAEAVLTLMEERGWLKADASRSVSSQGAAGREGAIDEIARLVRGRAWCTVCGRTTTVKDVDELRHGWMRCCGYTMTMDSPEDRAARSDSEDTQQAEGAANPSPQLQELIKAAEDFCAKVERGEARSKRSYAKFKSALQNVKKSNK